jgi:hypothetical protein
VVKEADLAATHPSSGVSPHSRTCPRSWSAYRGLQPGRVGRLRQPVRPSVALQFDAPTILHCCCYLDYFAAGVAVRAAAGAVAVVVGTGSDSRVHRVDGSDLRRRAQVESRPGSRAGATAS